MNPIDTKSASPLNFFVILLITLLFSQCADYHNINTNINEFTCESCHSNAALLQSITSDLSPGNDTLFISSSSETPDRWEKVYILAPGYTSFTDMEPTHSQLGCTSCHDGKSPVSDKNPTKAMEIAHSSGVIHDPSSNPGLRCNGSTCHGSLVESFSKSLHFTANGFLHSIDLRTSFFDSLNSSTGSIQGGFRRDCYSCHATCGQCHISRPMATGSGLISGHFFNPSPSPGQNCMSCHSWTVGAEFKGSLSGNSMDTHYQAGMSCTDCHRENLHGDGQKYMNIAEIDNLPDCATQCHSRDADDNLFHLSHFPGQGENSWLDCSVCHSQTYTSCSNCHSGEYEGNLLSGYTKENTFILGLNTQRDSDQIRWTTVRHVPVMENTFDAWGLQLDHYDQLETYKRSLPHNISRWTKRTLGDSSWIDSSTYTDSTCAKNCHYHYGSPEHTPVNDDLYLILTEIPDAEKNANKDVALKTSCDYSACHKF